MKLITQGCGVCWGSENEGERRAWGSPSTRWSSGWKHWQHWNSHIWLDPKQSWLGIASSPHLEERKTPWSQQKSHSSTPPVSRDSREWRSPILRTLRRDRGWIWTADRGRKRWAPRNQRPGANRKQLKQSARWWSWIYRGPGKKNPPRFWCPFRTQMDWNQKWLMMISMMIPEKKKKLQLQPFS